MEQDKLEGKELYYSMNGSFGAMVAIADAIGNGKVRDLQSLQDLVIQQLEIIHEKMDKLEKELGDTSLEEVFITIIENDFGRDTVVGVHKDQTDAVNFMKEKDNICKDNGFPYGHRIERHDVK